MGRLFISFLSLITLFSPSAWAVKRALVIGGATTREPLMEAQELTEATRPKHEFARSVARTALGLQAQGYEVTTFFDAVGFDAAAAPDLIGFEGMYLEKTRGRQRDMKRDYDKLASLGAQTATEERVLGALRSVRDQLSAGDEFEFSISAHGYRFCRDETGEMVEVRPESARFANSDPSCIHKIALIDPLTGAQTLVETSKIHDILKQIDAKGVRTNLNFASCHSGQTQKLFSDLPNTCSVFAASGNNVGMACMPDDAPGDLSYTTALDAIQTSQFIGIADQLLADPYFSDDPCTGKMLEHYRKNGIGGDNRYDLFMSARTFDRGFHEPTISSQVALNYFNTGHFSTIYSNLAKFESRALCVAEVQADIDNLLEFGRSVGATINMTEVNRLRADLLATMDHYAQIMARQQEVWDRSTPLKRQFRPDAPDAEAQLAVIQELDRQFKAIQDEALAYGSTIMEKERNLVAFVNQQFLRDAVAETDACVRN
jgi:hypothetical protein